MQPALKPAVRTVVICVASSLIVAAIATAMGTPRAPSRLVTGERAQRTQPPRALVLRHATLIDGTGSAPRRDMTVVMQEGRIAALFPDGQGTEPANADVRDVRGQWVLPGLIDAHVHLATNPSGSDRRARVELRLANALRGGVVAVRDMAGDARALADLARAADVGDIPAPHISYSALRSGTGFFADPRVRSASAGRDPGSAAWARAVSDTSDLRQVIAEARGTGARGIKLYADVPPSLVASIAEEARKQGMATWAHLVLFPAKPADVVRGGVDVVSHALLLAWEPASTLPTYERRADGDRTVGGHEASLQRLFADMKARGTLFEPTLWVYRAARAGDTIAAARQAQAFALTRAAHAAGVRIVAGTDGIGSEEPGALPNIHEELRRLVEGAGLSPMDAIVAATRHAAEAAGLADTHGTIAVGKAADLVLLASDPLASITNTKRIAAVIRHGRPVP